MKSYRHVLVLIHDERDGVPLLRVTLRRFKIDCSALFSGVREPPRCRCVGQAPGPRVANDKADFSHGFAVRKALTCSCRCNPL